MAEARERAFEQVFRASLEQQDPVIVLVVSVTFAFALLIGLLSILWFVVRSFYVFHFMGRPKGSGEMAEELYSEGKAEAVAGVPRLRGYRHHALGSLLRIGFVVLHLLCHGMMLTILERLITTMHMGFRACFVYCFAATGSLQVVSCMVVPYAGAWFLVPASLEQATAVGIEEEEYDAASFTIGSRLLRGAWLPQWLHFLREADNRHMPRLIVQPVTQEHGFAGRRLFQHKCVSYIWKADEGAFRPMDAVHVLSVAGLDSETVRHLQQETSRVLTGPTSTIFGALYTQLFQAYTIYQVYTCYLYLALFRFTLAIFIFFTCVGNSAWRALRVVRQQQRDLNELANVDQLVEVKRDGEWMTIGSAGLVPRDVIRLWLGAVPCDCVIAEGTAVVDESMLTGEPIPVQKMPIRDLSADFDPTKHKRNMLFAGSNLLDINKTICIVTAVGASTLKGQQVRLMLFPTAAQHNRFNEEMFQVSICIFVYSLLIMLIFFFAMPSDGRVLEKSFSRAMVQALENFCTVVHPLLPVAFSAGQHSVAHALHETGIRCFQPALLTFAGKLHVAIFDKTGTLTEPGMKLTFVRPIHDCAFCSMVWVDNGPTGAQELLPKGQPQPSWVIGMATCHAIDWVEGEEDEYDQASLTPVGPALDLSMFAASGWRYKGRVEAPAMTPHGSGVEMDAYRGPNADAEVLRRLEFDRHTRTSGAIVRVKGKGFPDGKTFVFVKGDVETLGATCKAPPNYHELRRKSQVDGLYSLAMACKDVTSIAADSLGEMPRPELEAGLDLVGLLLFANELRPETAAVLEELRGGLIRPVMCTGDNVLAAVTIAKGCALIPEGADVYIAEAHGEEVRWTGEDGVIDQSDEAAIMQGGELAVTGAAFDLLRQSGELKGWLKEIRVFAHMTPDQKVEVVRQYQAQNFVVSMCGDGGNDCGALRAAHVGVALTTTAAASIVAPFCSGAVNSIYCVVYVAKAGRACLATNVACYKVFVLAGLLTTLNSSWLGIFTDSWVPAEHLLYLQFIFPLLACLCLSWSASEAPGLAAKHIQSSLYAPHTFLSILVPFFATFAFTVLAWGMLPLQDWYFKPSVEYLRLGLFFWFKDPLIRPLADQFEPETAFILSKSVLMSAMLAYGSNSTFRGPVFKSPIVMGFTVGVVMSLAMLMYTSSIYTCMFCVNCRNGMPRPLVKAKCFFAPQLDIWLVPERYPNLFNGTLPQSYAMQSASKPPCFPEPSAGFPNSIRPNNVFPGSWTIVMTVLVLVLNGTNMYFLLKLLDPLCAMMQEYMGPRWYYSRDRLKM